MIKTDCFAYRSTPERCTALNDLYCKFEECGFYKVSAEDAPTTTAARVASNVKLTAEDVAWIRANYLPRDPEFNMLALAQKFGVREKTICDIVHNRSWRE